MNDHYTAYLVVKLVPNGSGGVRAAGHGVFSEPAPSQMVATPCSAVIAEARGRDYEEAREKLRLLVKRHYPWIKWPATGLSRRPALPRTKAT